jgi:hypothetical protein
MSDTRNAIYWEKQKIIIFSSLQQVDSTVRTRAYGILILLTKGVQYAIREVFYCKTSIHNIM